MKNNITENIKMNLFARWISICYADEHLDEKMRYQGDCGFDSSSAMSVLNRENGIWWKKQLEHFNNVVYPNYKKNGSVKSANEFLKDISNK